MNCYGPLAAWYDQFTGDVPYSDFADFYEAEFSRGSGEFRLLLDLCCGTGTLTWEMARRGYELIAVDASVDMLMQAQCKAGECAVAPLFLHQKAEKLDLYGTVDGAYCSLDSMNYIPGELLPQVFHRLSLFIRPGGLLIFDIHPEDWFRSLDGSVFVDENEDALCLWRADFDSELNAIIYGMDIFSRQGQLWTRESEEHREYAHSFDFLREALEKAGFTHVHLTRDCPQGDNGRAFIIATRG